MLFETGYLTLKYLLLFISNFTFIMRHTGLKLGKLGKEERFNNYVTLKLPFLTHLPFTITLCHVCSREHSCVTSRSAQTSPLSIKYKILRFKKDRSRSKEISFVFHMFFFSSPEDAIFKEYVLKTHSFNIRI